MFTLLLSLGTAAAATLDVCPSGCTYQTIQPAIDAATATDVVEVGTGTYPGFSIIDRTGVTVRAASGQMPVVSGTVVGSDGRDEVIDIRRSQSVVVAGLDVVGGERRGISVVNADAMLQGVTIRDSRLAFGGGGMLVWASTLVVEDSLFHNNHVDPTVAGGHMVSTLDSSVTLIDTDFTDGTARSGGAVWATGGTLEISGGTFSGNEAVVDAVGGGAVYMQGGTLTITDAAFVDNVSASAGGHISLRLGNTANLLRVGFDGGEALEGAHISAETATVDVTDSTFIGGTAPEGGQVRLSTASFTAAGSMFESGAAEVGAGILADFSTVFLDGIDARGHRATEVGGRDGVDDSGNGGFLAARGTQVTVTSGSFDDVVATNDGGALWVESGSLLVTDAGFSNSIADKGGALALYLPTAVEISGALFSDNEAGEGGAIYRDGTGRITLTDSVFSRNGSTGRGGALAAQGQANVTLLDVRFVENTAQDGGAMSLREGSGLVSTRTLWCSNAATGNGGGFWADSRTIQGQFANAVWIENVAANGGAAWTKGAEGTLTFEHNTFVANDASDGAAIFAQQRAVSLQQSILAGQVAGPAVTATVAGQARIAYTDWWQNLGGDVGGALSTTDLGPTNLFVDPMFQSMVPSGTCDDRVWVDHTSPTVDAGNPDDADPADTIPSSQMPADMGALGGPSADPAAWLDADADGWPVMWDCDDTAGDTYPNAPELCDGVDNNCNGLVDDEAQGLNTYYSDSDGDGFGLTDAALSACTPPDETWVTAPGDCDDASADVFPGAPEACNGVDDDCDEQVDNDPVDGTLVYADVDGDDFGDSDQTLRTCGDAPEGFTEVPGDCDDSNPTTYPFAPELCDGVSNDCDDEIDEDPSDGQAYTVDLDGDGFAGDDVITACSQPPEATDVVGDCDDTESEVNPSAIEACNGIDDDCDGVVDPPGSTGSVVAFTDADSDGYGDPETEQRVCTLADDQVDRPGDCDDSEITVFADADEVCDGLDNDCDGTVDEDVVGLAVWYEDSDGDDFGSESGQTIESCIQPEGYVSNRLDCDDTDPDVQPNASERCNGLDDNCDGEVDEGAADAVVVYADQDGDGQGAADSVGERVCDAGDRPTTATDCDDTNADVFAGADEICDGVDNDCDDQVDEDVAFEQWYVDADRDGYGGEAVGPPDCAPPEEGAVRVDGDCNDDDATVFPGADEVVGDGVDQDCDGLDTLDDPISSREFEPSEDTGVQTDIAGCDCQTGTAPSGALWWSLGAGLLLVSRRRRAGVK